MAKINLRRACVRFASAIPVIFVVALLSWVYIVYVFMFIPDIWRTCGAFVCLFYASCFHWLFGLFSLSYYKVVATDPGSPRSWQSLTDLNSYSTSGNYPLREEREGEEQEYLTVEFPIEQVNIITAKRNGEPRRCRKCNNRPKPDRAHHCSICGRCILKMDHHCPWINNCVGFHNQKFFILFVLYGAVLGLYSFGTVTLYLASVQHNSDSLQSQLQMVLMDIVGLVFGLVLAGFGAMHCSFILANKTTIESWARHRYLNVDQSELMRRRRGYNVNVFDIGWRGNWEQVMGSDWRYWFIPIGNSQGDGHEFPFNNQALSHLVRSTSDTTS